MVPFDDDPDSPGYQSLSMQERSAPKKKKPKRRRTLPFHRIFTRNVCITLLSRGLLAMHIGTFSNLWYVFLSTPRSHNRRTGDQVDLFHFTGGLALPPAKIGLALSILAGVGITIQLFLYPRISHRFGTVNCFRFSLVIFPLVYFIVPFLAILPSSTPVPLPASGIVIWAGILSFLGLHVFARMFAMPSATILVNNCCPHPSVLSTIHGVAQSVASGMRMAGPMLGGWGFGVGLNAGIVGAAFWVLMCVASSGVLVGMLVQEGTGHEIVLEGDEEYEKKDAVEMKSKRNP
jgi:MFS family permease